MATTRYPACLGCLAAACLGVGSAQAGLITFESLSHGEIVANQLSGDDGVEIRALNPNRSHDLAIIFDSLERGTEDPDLEGPVWARGNLAPDTVLGNLLIIAENDVDGNGDGFIDRPDDEGRRPAGSLIFDFETPVTSFGLDVIDVEGVMVESGSLHFYTGDDLRATVPLSDFVDLGKMFYDETVEFGDNSANRLPVITAADLELDFFDSVRVNLGGSGAIDNIMYSTLPSPGAGALLLLSFVAGRDRRRRA